MLLHIHRVVYVCLAINHGKRLKRSDLFFLHRDGQHIRIKQLLYHNILAINFYNNISLILSAY